MSNEDIVIGIMEQLRDELRTINEGFARLTAIFEPQPPRREQVDSSGLQKPLYACQRSGCMRTDLVGETAYCGEHEGDVRG